MCAEPLDLLRYAQTTRCTDTAAVARATGRSPEFARALLRERLDVLWHSCLRKLFLHKLDFCRARQSTSKKRIHSLCAGFVTYESGTVG